MRGWERKKRAFKRFCLLFVVCFVSAFALFYLGTSLNRTVSRYSNQILDLKKNFDKYDHLQKQYKNDFEKQKRLLRGR